MELKRDFYTLQVTKLELTLIIESLNGYSEYVENITENSYPEPSRLAQELQQLMEVDNAK